MFGLFFHASARGAMLLACAMILLNTLFFQNPIAGGISLFLYLASAGALVGPTALPNRTRGLQTAIGASIVIATVSIVGSILYYIGPVYQSSFLAMIVILGLFTTLFGKHAVSEESTKAPAQPIVFAAMITVVLFLAAWWSAVLSVSATSPVRTPWELLDPVAIIALALAILAVGTVLTRSRAAGAVLTGATFFSAIAVAATAYPLGFGFDPFIHRTTVAHIAEHGTITPKPFYYIGQYVLELVSVHVFSLPLHLTDTLLIPILATLIVVASAAASFGALLKTKTSVALLAVFLLPLSAFIVTTPQSLAYVFTIAVLFLSLPRLLRQENAPPLIVLALLTLAALVTHPLAGIPACIYFALVAVTTWQPLHSALRIAGVTLGSIAGAIALPAVFAFQARQSGLDISFNPGGMFSPNKLEFTGYFSNRFSTTFDGLYLVIDNSLWILLILAAAGGFFIARHKANPALHLPLIAALIWLVNYWILSTTLEFSFLIEYERQNYSARLLTLTAIFLVPHAGFAIAGMMEHLKNKPAILRFAVVTLVAALATANIYGAYPRHDNYARSAGFNVGEHDFDAAYAIDRAAGAENYIVLANQAVSAAALEAFGFKKYYHGDIFYYPIPTGGALYQIYLEMADDEPTRERAEAAMDLTGASLVYFAVNEYWWRSDVIIERAKQTADEWFAVGEGAVTVFVYVR